MELAGLSFLDSPGSGSVKFLEPKARRASSLLAQAFNPKHKPFKRNRRPEKTYLIIASYPSKLSSQNKLSKLVIVDPG